jgi:phosphoadenosine phosphosulfate reductase
MGAVDLHARASAEFDARLEQTRALLIRAAAEFAPLKQASSLGAEDVVITHLIDNLALDIPVFVLDTGMLHPQTLELLERTKANPRLRIQVNQPVQETVVEFVAREGAEPMYKSIELRKACCHIRKVEPLERALAGQRAWITGLRREQSNARAEVPLIDTTEDRIKLSPLADWSWGDVWHYIGVNAVDYNPLHDAFFPSIGCAPCTRAISLGEDFRAGRWWWEDNSVKECGLHVMDAGPLADDGPFAIPAHAATAIPAQARTVIPARAAIVIPAQARTVIPARAATVIPAQAGNQNVPGTLNALDSRLRGNDDAAATSSHPAIATAARR